MAQLRRDKPELDRAGLQVLLVGMGTPEQAEAFRDEFRVPFPLVGDQERDLYREYGLERASLGQVLSPEILAKSVRALGRGHWPGAPRGDVMQMPGAFVIDRTGMVRFRHCAADPSDHPEVAALIGAARSDTP